MNLGHLHFVIKFDIKKFFDNVNHEKLIRQMWTLGIRDKWLLLNIIRILKTPIKEKYKLIYPDKETPQGGIISPLLANLRKGTKNGYRAMRKTKLKEMYIVRYADDFRIFCRTKTVAEKPKWQT